MRRVWAAERREKRVSSAILYLLCCFLPVVFSNSKNDVFWLRSGFFAVALTEDGSTSLSLIADHTTHGDFLSEDLNVSITKKSA